VIGPPQLGAPALELVGEIQAADPAQSLDRMTKRQRAVLRLKDELGDLVARPGRLLEIHKQKAEKKKT